MIIYFKYLYLKYYYIIYKLPLNMYLIKQYITINRVINKLINYIKYSIPNATKIGKEISLYNYNIYDQMLLISKQTAYLQHNIKYQALYHFIEKLNSDCNLNLSLDDISIINVPHFFYKFNKKLYKLKKIHIYSYLRGYYINNLYIYSTNMNTYNITLFDSNLYFVLYDFNTEYLDYIYYNVLKSIKYPPKIKYLKNTYLDKYSINEITDIIPYKLVFVHKNKYYHNIIKVILSLLFTSINDELDLNDDEINLFILLNKINSNTN